MIFAVRVGSKGTGEESYTIRIPINISPSSKIEITPGEIPLNIGGYPAAIFEDQKLELYILEVYGFLSKEAASESLSSIQAGLVWAALHHRISLPFSRQTTPVVYEELTLNAETQLFRPLWEKGWDRVDGYYRSGYTVIKPEHKRLYVEAFGSFNVVPNVSDRALASTVAEAVNFSNPEKLFHDDELRRELRRALNVYMSSFFQFDANARFLTLVIVLEILNPNKPAPKHVRDTVKQLRSQVKKLRDDCDEGNLDPRYDDYDYLLDRLRHLERESIRQGIGFLVAENLRSDPQVADADEVGREAKKIYDLRSDLVHSGAVDEGEVRTAIQRLMDIVPRVLSAMVLRATDET